MDIKGFAAAATPTLSPSNSLFSMSSGNVNPVGALFQTCKVIKWDISSDELFFFLLKWSSTYSWAEMASCRLVVELGPVWGVLCSHLYMYTHWLTQHQLPSPDLVIGYPIRLRIETYLHYWAESEWPRYLSFGYICHTYFIRQTYIWIPV